MPKTNDATGATYAGYEGVVEHAGGAGSTRPGGLSELNPTKDLDGEDIEGLEVESEEGDGTDATEVTQAEGAPLTAESAEGNKADEREPREESAPATPRRVAQKRAAAQADKK